MTAAPGIRVEGSATILGATLFEPLALDIVPGQWTCLLGASGVGKSTILRLIAGLETKAEFSGHVAALDDTGILGRVAYMAQQDLLLPWASAIQNVALGARLRGERVDQARVLATLAQVGLEAHGQKKPHELSGGERQRVALARTLMEDKAIVLLDEPFSALDAKTRAEMQDLSFQVLQGRTVLLVTHDPGEAVRLGHVIQLMRKDGLTRIDTPPGNAPRPVDDPDTLMAQGRLMAELRGAS